MSSWRLWEPQENEFVWCEARHSGDGERAFLVKTYFLVMQGRDTLTVCLVEGAEPTRMGRTTCLSVWMEERGSRANPEEEYSVKMRVRSHPQNLADESAPFPLTDASLSLPSLSCLSPQNPPRVGMVRAAFTVKRGRRAQARHLRAATP